MQTPDFWSVPFAPVAADGAVITAPVREVVGAIASVAPDAVPATFGDALGTWCTGAFAALLDPDDPARREPGARPPVLTRPRLGGVIVVLCAVNLLVAADFLGASVLLDPIGRDLHMDTATLAWVVNGYLLTLAAPLIAFGRAADAVGALRLTRVGLLAFALGAAVTGCARVRGAAHRGADGAGGRCVDPHRDRALAREHRGRAGRAWPGRGDLGRGRRHRVGGRTAPRRRAGGARLVAPLLPDRRAVRPGGALVPAPRARRRPLRRSGRGRRGRASPA